MSVAERFTAYKCMNEEQLGDELRLQGDSH